MTSVRAFKFPSLCPALEVCTRTWPRASMARLVYPPPNAGNELCTRSFFLSLDAYVHYKLAFEPFFLSFTLSPLSLRYPLLVLALVGWRWAPRGAR